MLNALIEIMAAGSGGSTMSVPGPMRAHDYSTLFKLEHMLKDVRLCLEEGQAAGVPFTFAGHARASSTPPRWAAATPTTTWPGSLSNDADNWDHS